MTDSDGKEAGVPQAPAIGISVSLTDPSQTRTIVMQTHFPQDADPKFIDLFLDMTYRTNERQQLHYRISDLLAKKRGHEREHRLAITAFRRLEEKMVERWQGRGPPKFEGAEKQARENAMVNIEALAQEIAVIDAQVLELRQQLAQ